MTYTKNKWIGKYRNRRLSTTISIVFILLILGVMGSFSLILYGYFQNVIERNITKSVDTAVNVNASMLENLFQRIDFSCDLVHDNKVVFDDQYAERSSITEMIVNYIPMEDNSNLYQLSNEYSSNLKLFNDYFSSCFGSEIRYSNILFVDSRWPIHKFMPQKDDGESWKGFSSDIEVKESAWYQKTLGLNGDTYWFTDKTMDCLCMAKVLKLRNVNMDLTFSEENIGVMYLCIKK